MKICEGAALLKALRESTTNNLWNDDWLIDDVIPIVLENQTGLQVRYNGPQEMDISARGTEITPFNLGDIDLSPFD